mmetsp:Transcript_52314/g.146790  ORF Transcript_52314/g.146790 Transcript_52314/m.146790 type:complete len:360 (+) Transcript_52314:98-1177(+)
MAPSIAVLTVAVVFAGAAAAAEEPALRGAAAADGVPFWCRFVPERLQTSRCRGGRSGAAAQNSACARLTEQERALTPRCAFSEREALDFFHLSSAAFCDSTALESWDCGPSCDHVRGMKDVRRIDENRLDAHAFVGRWRDRCVLAFRGTDSFDGWVQDLKSLELVDLPGCASCRVGAGFLESYEALSKGIRKSLAEIGCDKAPLSVTGHSMGAALATLAAFDLRRSSFNVTMSHTFGQPRVGDDAFAAAFNEEFADVPFFRVTRADDPIVYLPYRDPFHHVGTEVFYRGDTTHGHRVCDGSGEDPACAGQADDAEVAVMLLQCLVPRACGHMRYLQPVRRAGAMSSQACRSGSRGTLLP